MTRAMKTLKELKPAEVSGKIKDLRKEYLVLKAQAATGTPPKNPMQLRNIRRTIARLHTLGTQQSSTSMSGTPSSSSGQHPIASKDAKKNDAKKAMAATMPPSGADSTMLGKKTRLPVRGREGTKA